MVVPLTNNINNFNCGHSLALRERMTLKTHSFALAIVLSVAFPTLSIGQDAQPKPDNTKVNERSRP